MSRERNLETIQAIYASFGRGDVQAILDTLSDDVRWVTHLDPAVPWSGDYSGKSNVPRFFDAIFASVDVLAFEPQEWIVDGGNVVSIGAFGCRVKATGKEARTRWIFLWSVKDGVVTSYEQFHDEAMSAAFR